MFLRGLYRLTDSLLSLLGSPVKVSVNNFKKEKKENSRITYNKLIQALKAMMLHIKNQFFLLILNQSDWVWKFERLAHYAEITSCNELSGDNCPTINNIISC